MQVQDRKYSLKIDEMLGERNSLRGTKYKDATLEVEVEPTTPGSFILKYEAIPPAGIEGSFAEQPREYQDSLQHHLDEIYQAVSSQVTQGVYYGLERHDPHLNADLGNPLKNNMHNLYTKVDYHDSTASESQVTQAFQNTMLSMAATAVPMEKVTATEMHNRLMNNLRKQIQEAVVNAGCDKLSDDQLDAVAVFAYQHKHSASK